MKAVLRLEDGTKARQTNDAGQRERIYKDWHYKLGRDLLCTDIDCVEWRYKDGILTPVALIEVTMVSDDWTVNNTYLNSILERYSTQMQGDAAKHIATSLGVYAFITLFRSHLMDFWVYNLSLERGWFHLNQDDYVSFLRRL